MLVGVSNALAFVRLGLAIAPDLGGHLRALHAAFQTAPFDAASLEQALRALAEIRGVKAGTLIHATRLAVTGRMVSPGLFEMLVLVGRDRVVSRMRHLIDRVCPGVSKDR